MSKRTRRRTNRTQASRRSARKTGVPRPARVVFVVAAVVVIAITVTVFLMQPRVPSFDGDRALRDVVRMVSFGPRVPGTEAHAEGLAFIRGRLDSLADQVSLQDVSLAMDGDTLVGSNIIASFNLNPDRNIRILLGAHWDSRPFADRDPDPAKRTLAVPGANDGASGVAVLLEMARLLHEHPPEIGVDIILFDLEDAGVDSTIPFAVGAEHFAASNAQYRPTFGIVVDMVCDANLRLPREGNSQQAARWVVDLVWRTAKDIDAEAFLDEVAGGVTDDHLPFLRRGIPVIDVIQAPFPDYWHTTSDTADKCSGESLNQVGSVLATVVYTQ